MKTNLTYKKEISECIVLSNQVPNMQFEYSSADFKLEIISGILLIDPTINWVQLIPKIEVWIQVIGYSMNDNGIVPSFKLNFIV